MRRILVVLTAIAVPILAAGPSLATIHQVNVSDFVFSPKSVTVATGDTVKWVWVSGMHTATSGDTTACTANGIFDLPIDSAHPTGMFRFTSVGQFPYLCRFHCLSARMRGLVTVQNTAGVPQGTASRSLTLDAAPNPFQPETVLSFMVDRSGPVRVEIFDASGRRIATVANANYEPGIHTARWDGRTDTGTEAPSGIYFARRVLSGSIATVVLMRVR